jgi:hypothetical protein
MAKKEARGKIFNWSVCLLMFLVALLYVMIAYMAVKTL